MDAKKFKNGERIYDSDGNEYVVENSRAVHYIGQNKVSYFLGSLMAENFSRDRPIK